MLEHLVSAEVQRYSILASLQLPNVERGFYFTVTGRQLDPSWGGLLNPCKVDVVLPWGSVRLRLPVYSVPVYQVSRPDLFACAKLEPCRIASRLLSKGCLSWWRPKNKNTQNNPLTNKQQKPLHLGKADMSQQLFLFQLWQEQTNPFLLCLFLVA